MCSGGRRLHPQHSQSVFEEDEAEEAAESLVKLLQQGQGLLLFSFVCYRLNFSLS